MNNHWLYETTLKGKLVTLVPLKRDHTKALLEAAADGELWNLWYTSVPNSQTIDVYLNQAFKDQADGRALLFVVIDKATQKIIGSTRYCNADSINQRVEIGYTWYAK
jgi:N-acetyltransferase